MAYKLLSEESERVLKEIISNESNSDYWKERFDNLSPKDQVILSGCFGELSDKGMISVNYMDNYPYYISVLRDGYLYEEYCLNQCSSFEKKIQNLLMRADYIISIKNGTKFHQQSEEWMNDVQIFKDTYLYGHSLEHRMTQLLFHRSFKDLVACIKSISNDRELIDRMGESNEPMISNSLNEYDVFISHANKDKPTIIDELYESLSRLGIKIFYDKRELEWGDNWKERILEGVEKSEFAIIVISDNFFGREWTEKELTSFLNRQNISGQKIILPLLFDITIDQLKDKYPSVSDIQAISTETYTCDQVALLFAKQLIKRLKGR